MSDVLTALIDRAPVLDAVWSRFWDRLATGNVRREEAAAILAAFSAAVPDVESVRSFISSLEDRRPAAPRLDDCVSVVSTGGGPRTFHIGTAAALVAATMGVPVIKTGSCALTSDVGSVDLLERIGIPLACSYEAVAGDIERFGIAFTSPFVYPDEIGMLARRIFPLDFKVAGRFINRIGPVLASLRTAAQLTGVSDPAVLPVLQALGHRDPDRRLWLCTNDPGVPALLSISANTTYENGVATTVAPHELGLGGGTLADLAPADGADPVERLRRVLTGDAPAASLRTVCLNAAALAVLGGWRWTDAVAEARAVLSGGTAADLIDRLRSAGQPVHARW